MCDHVCMLKISWCRTHMSSVKHSINDYSKNNLIEHSLAIDHDSRL